MKLSELINHVGDEHVTMQNLGKNVATVSKGKKDAKVTFYTSNEHADSMMGQVLGRGPKYVALRLDSSGTPSNPVTMKRLLSLFKRRNRRGTRPWNEKPERLPLLRLYLTQFNSPKIHRN
jgi:hypothetical protein